MHDRGEDGTLRLSRSDYERLLEAAETYREELVVRLAGEAGLRATEIARVRPGNVRAAAGDSGGSLIDVPVGTDGRDGSDSSDDSDDSSATSASDAASDGGRTKQEGGHDVEDEERGGDAERTRSDEDGAATTSRPQDGDASRIAYLPRDLERALDRYVQSNDIGPDERIVDVTSRRVQMLVAEVGARAADETGDDRFQDVSSSALRRFFARTLLVEEGVELQVVKRLGGWKRWESVASLLEPLDEERITAAVASATVRDRTAASDRTAATDRAHTRWRTAERRSGDQRAESPRAVDRRPGDRRSIERRTVYRQSIDRRAVDRRSDDLRPEDRRTANGGRLRSESSARSEERAGPPLGESDHPTRPAPLDRAATASLLAHSATYGIAKLDADGYVLRWRPGAAADDLERDPVGDHLSAFYGPSAAAERPARHLAIAAETGRYEGEGWHVTPDGDQFWGIVVITADRNDGSGAYTMLVWDGTERRERTAALRSRLATTRRRRAVAEVLRDVDDALLTASTRDELEEAVCRQLAADSYECAWVAASDLSENGQTVRARAGIEDEAIERISDRFVDGGHTSPSAAAIRSGDVRTTEVRFRSGDERRELALAAVPIAHRETTYGALIVGTDGATALRRWERDALRRVGRRMGHAVTAIQRRRLLLSDAAVQLEFWSADDRAFFVAASERLDCAFALESIVPVSESSLLFYATVEGAPPDDVVELAADHRGIEAVRAVERHDDGGLLELVVGESPVLTLTAYGATIAEVVADGGDARIVAELPRDTDLRTVVEGVKTAFPTSELVGKHDVERSARSVRTVRESVADRLTDRQEAALRAAFYGGYFDWPRASTAEEIADAMDVSSPTLHNHLRKGQRELLRVFFEGPSTTREDAAGEQRR